MVLRSVPVLKMSIMGNTMPAKAPSALNAVTARLALLGQRIHARRKGLGVSATALAESSGMSRLTVYRIEHGEASVTMGAYLNALAALGMDLTVVDCSSAAYGPAPALDADSAQAGPGALPARIRLADHAQLRQLAWQVPGAVDLSPQEALALYERNWRHVDPQGMLPSERRLVDQLVLAVGQGHLLV